MGKKLILCNTYQALRDTLCLANINYPDTPTTIMVADKRNLFKFIQTVNENAFHNSINLIFFASYYTGKGTRKGLVQKLLHLLPDMVNERRYLNEYFNISR